MNLNKQQSSPPVGTGPGASGKENADMDRDTHMDAEMDGDEAKGEPNPSDEAAEESNPGDDGEEKG